MASGGGAVAGLGGVERLGQGLALGGGEVRLARLPPEPAADRADEKQERAEQPPAVAGDEIRHLLLAELLVHLSQEGFAIVRLERQDSILQMRESPGRAFLSHAVDGNGRA